MDFKTHNILFKVQGDIDPWIYVVTKTTLYLRVSCCFH